MAEAELEIPSVAVVVLRAALTENYTATGKVELKFAISTECDNPSDEDLEEIKDEMQHAFEEHILDISALILKKWGEGLFPIASRVSEEPP